MKCWFFPEVRVPANCRSADERHCTSAGRGYIVTDMKIAMLQMNSMIADFAGNARTVLDLARHAEKAGAELAVCPELCLTGYPPLDLLDYDRFVEDCLKQVRLIQREAPAELGLIIGYIDRNRSGHGKSLVNTAALIHQGKIQFSQQKTLLPTYDVFDESRYFEPAAERKTFVFKNTRIGIAICEDIWWEQERSGNSQYPIDPVKELLDQGTELLVVPSASPFYSGKPAVRLALLKDLHRVSGIPICYVNLVGGNDSLIFDGQSLYISAAGELEALGKGFEEDMILVETGQNGKPLDLPDQKWLELEQALVLGIRDYLHKCGFSHAHLGLSGGIDSALVAMLATLALGKENVTAFSLPSRYS
ncbi:MAG TPA: NAD+ synthase, partial [Spirochaetia bacterium]|nr:NAD+ synthase [Spirochaetia bacterium]